MPLLSAGKQTAGADYIRRFDAERWRTHIAAVEGQLEEVRRTVSNHVLERVVVQAKVLLRRTHWKTNRKLIIKER